MFRKTPPQEAIIRPIFKSRNDNNVVTNRIRKIQKQKWRFLVAVVTLLSVVRTQRQQVEVTHKFWEYIDGIDDKLQDLAVTDVATVAEQEKKNGTRFFIHNESQALAVTDVASVAEQEKKHGTRLFIHKESQALAVTDVASVAEQEKKNGTRLFIHVGPVKTGSSSIQCNLQVNRFLKKSSYEFMGRKESICPESEYRQLKRNKDYYNLQEFVNQYILRGWLKQEQFQDYVTNFKKTFRSKDKEGINTIFSAEEFCLLLKLEPPYSDEDDRLQQFANLLNDIPQTIIFQVFYRHYFDWALSYYNFYGLHPIRSDFKRSPGSAASITTETNFFGGKLEQHVCSPNAMLSFLKDKLIPLLDRASVEVFDFHGDGDDLANRYICGLPDAEVACEETRANLNLKKARVTETDQIHADRIAMAAWEKGMYSNSEAVKNQRQKVRNIIIDHVRNDLNMSLMELELECLADSALSESLNSSIRIGKQMLGEEKLDVEALKSRFRQSQSKQKFCSVNITSILMDPGWQQFLSAIEVGA